MRPTPSPVCRNMGGLILVVFLILAARLVQIQVFEAEVLRGCARRQWEKKVALPALRGNIYDRHGIPLALSRESYKVTTDPGLVAKLGDDQRARFLETLADNLDLSDRKIGRLLRKGGRYVVLRENRVLDPEQKRRLQESGLVNLERRAERIYPLGDEAAALIGFVNDEGSGMSGLEAGLQEHLSGRPGEELVQKDDRGRTLISPQNRIVRAPKRGRDVYLTIDHKVQAIADAELARAAQTAGAERGAVVVLDPHSGDILALASWPAPEDRLRGRYRPEQWKLLAVQGSWEPGSTMKALSAIALLESGGIDQETEVDTENGRAVIEGIGIRDDKPHFGWHSFREVFTLSSNIGFAKLSQRISDNELYACYRDLGFGLRIGLPLPGEADGVLRPPGDWSRRSRMTLSFGQELSATPLQISSAYCALAADGRLMKPRLVIGLQAEDGKVAEEKQVYVRRVCDSSTTGTIRDLLRETVATGTGQAAAIEGLTLGGKTGTAQKFADGKLKAGSYFASFVGLAPVEEPKLVIGVFLDDPGAAYRHGGQSAAPAFARIVERVAVSTAWLEDVILAEAPGGGKTSGKPLPSFLGLEREAAEQMAIRARWQLSFSGRGDVVLAQIPAAGVALAAGGRVKLILGGGGGRSAVLPDLAGLSLRDARRAALEAGYTVLPSGRGIVTRQEQARPDGTIPIRLSEKRGSTRL